MHTNLEKTVSLPIYAATLEPRSTTTDSFVDWLWNSNHVLYWCTATTTNKIAVP